MKPTNEVTAIVIDNSGSYVHLAQRLSKDFKRVLYCNMAWQDAYSTPKKVFIGEGLDGIEVVESPWDDYSEIDLFVFPDVYQGPFQEWLKSQGEKVWGSGVAEELELERDVLKEHMQKLDLPVQPWDPILGLDNLRVYLQENDNVYVKVNKWRGLMESFYSKNYQLIEPFLNELEHNLGPMKSLVTFTVEEPITPADELGYDGYTVNGTYPSKTICGVEVKDKAFVCKFIDYKSISPLVTGFNDKMVDTFKRYGCTGFFHLETRVTPDKTPYMIDFTARLGCPPGELEGLMWTNLGDIIWHGANNELVDPVCPKVFGCELLLESEWAVNNYQPVYFPDKYKDQVKLKKVTKIDGINYIIPQQYGSNDIGACCGVGDTLDEAVKDCIKVAKSIEGQDIHVRIDTLDDASKTFEVFEKLNENK